MLNHHHLLQEAIRKAEDNGLKMTKSFNNPFSMLRSFPDVLLLLQMHKPLVT